MLKLTAGRILDDKNAFAVSAIGLGYILIKALYAVFIF